MTLPKPSIVIFDMDGTTVRHVNPYLLHVLERLDDAAFYCVRFKDWILRRGAKGAMFFDVDQDALKKRPKLLVHRAMHHLRRKEVEQIVEPCPGIYSVLNFLRAHNIPMGLASNGLGKGYGHDILEKFDLEQYFPTTIFREDIHKAKPNPEAILLVIRDMNLALKPDDVIWYIGDRRKDIIAASNAQSHLPCPVVPIACGFNAAVAVVEKNIGADHIILSHHDLYARLFALLGHPLAPSLSSPAKAGEPGTAEDPPLSRRMTFEDDFSEPEPVDTPKPARSTG